MQPRDIGIVIACLITAVTIGIVWQFTMTLISIYLAIREFQAMWITIAILVVTMVLMKKNRYDNLEEC